MVFGILELLIVESQDLPERERESQSGEERASRAHRTELRGKDGQDFEEEQTDGIVRHVAQRVFRGLQSGEIDLQHCFLVVPKQFEVFQDVQRRQVDLPGHHLRDEFLGVVDSFLVLVLVELLRLSKKRKSVARRTSS